MLSRSNQHIGGDPSGPDGVLPPSAVGLRESKANRVAEQPPTLNPPASELTFTKKDTDDLESRLQSYNKVSEDAIQLDMAGALVYATAHSREYTFEEEEYVLACLDLLIERHLWGPRFFDEISAIASGLADNGRYDTSLRLVNEFRVTQRLPYGGEVSARALADTTEDLHRRVAGEEFQTADVLLEADIPLLRGAGTVAREDRIQAERNVIYAARDFEQFRRSFLFDIAEQFLSLVVQQQAILNAERQVERLTQVEQRERTLYEAGRTTRFQAALAEQSTISAIDALNSRREAYRLTVDRFKVRLGMPVEQDVIIIQSGLDLPIPEVSLEQAVRQAMLYRLDLQNERDQTDDARRVVDNAKNGLLPDLDFNGLIGVPTDLGETKGGLSLDPGDAAFEAGLRLSLPLDREIERVVVRQAEIRLDRAVRDFDELRDDIAASVRNAVREIDRARYTLKIQEQSVAIGLQRKASIDAAPDRASARDSSDAANELLRAQDRRDTARRDLQLAVLQYLLETGQLRVDQQGQVLSLPGMREEPDLPADGGTPGNPDPTVNLPPIG